jgi:hypothetical protein
MSATPELRSVGSRSAILPNLLLPAFARRAEFSLVAALLLLLLLATTVALPLATYTTALAFFGLAHVGSELRYIDYRFGIRLRGGFGLWIGASLFAAVAMRLASIVGLMPPALAVGLEIGFGAMMTAACVVVMRSHRSIGILVAMALFCGAVVAPFETLLFLAIAHNLTPLGFLADALTGSVRRRVLAVMAIPFVVLPLLIATGLPFRLLARLGLVAPDAALLASGGLEANLGAYVPATLVDSDWALHIFAAAVFAQCMHYVTVIVILPRLIDGRVFAATLVSWPRAALFFAYLAFAALTLAFGFAVDFKVARQVYGLIAMVHSWIEIPILVLALDRLTSAGPQARPSA